MNRYQPRLVPDDKGSYILLFQAPEDFIARVGKLGRFSFRQGAYAYCGSAFGPGGLKARIDRHIRIRKKKHWHIDYVRPRLSLEKIIVSPTAQDECRWSSEMIKTGFEIPVNKLGSSDCHCRGHFFFTQCLGELIERVRTFGVEL